MFLKTILALTAVGIFTVSSPSVSAEIHHPLVPTHHQLIGIGDGETCVLEPGTLEIKSLYSRGKHGRLESDMFWVTYHRDPRHKTTAKENKEGPCQSSWDIGMDRWAIYNPHSAWREYE